MGTRAWWASVFIAFMQNKGKGEVALLFPFNARSLPSNASPCQMEMEPWLEYLVSFWQPSWGPLAGWVSWEHSAWHDAQEGWEGPWCWAHAHLVFLLEAVALGTLHLRDVLEQVCYPDGGVQLPRLVGHFGRLALLVRVRLHQAAGVTGHRVGFVWEKKVRRKWGWTSRLCQSHWKC